MDALSAIKTFFAPPVRNLPEAGGAGAVQPLRIPQDEIQKLGTAGRTTGVQGVSGDGFGNVLGSLVQEVNDKQIASKETVNALLSGQNVSLHQAMIAMEEASVSFQLMAEVRNKLLESYQELMRMQV